MILNLPVRNTNTGLIHYGTVDTEKLAVTKIHCGKPTGPQYEIAQGEKLTCRVCKSKMTGTRMYRRIRSR